MSSSKSTIVKLKRIQNPIVPQKNLDYIAYNMIDLDTLRESREAESAEYISLSSNGIEIKYENPMVFAFESDVDAANLAVYAKSELENIPEVRGVHNLENYSYNITTSQSLLEIDFNYSFNSDPNCNFGNNIYKKIVKIYSKNPETIQTVMSLWNSDVYVDYFSQLLKE